MFKTLLRFIILICLCCPALRMSSKQDITSRIMGKTKKFDSKTLDEEDTLKLKDLKNNKVGERSFRTRCVTTTQEYISTDLCFIFLYHLTSRKTTESILATTALFFWKVSAFPVNCTASSTDRTTETGIRKSRSVSNELSKGDCEEDWFEFKEKCYRTFAEVMNYNAADEYCKSVGSELTNIHTMNQNNFVRDLSNEQGVSGYLWTAVQKACMNCTQTVDGYTNWSPGQPTSVSKCVAMDPRGQWRDFDCGYMFAFVCGKALSQTYTKSELLAALLVPVFSCLTVAVSITTALLVSSVRRGGQPFKVSSRYQRTKKERRPTNWDMVDILRRASLKGARPKPAQRPSMPSIEITKAEIPKAESTNGTILSNGIEKKKRWYKKSNADKSLNVPEERRRSSNSSGHSSLYELLARLNSMEFAPPDETRLNNPEDEIEMKDLGEHKNGVKAVLDEDDDKLSGSHKQLVEKKEKHEDTFHSRASFRNMAFRDSVVNVETDGSGVAKVTSVQQMKQKDTVGTIEATTSNVQDHDLDWPSRDSPRERSRDNSLRDKSRVCSRDSCSHDSCSCDSTRDEDREETEASKNTQTVRADVHIISRNASVSTRNVEKQSVQKRQPSKGKVIWTYSL